MTLPDKVCRAVIAAMLIVMLAPAAAVAAPDEERTKIMVRDSAVVNDQTIHLSDVADINGPEPQLIDRLGSVVVGYAPHLDKMVNVSRSAIRERLENRNWAHGVVLDGCSVAEVRRAAVRIPAQKIKELGIAYVEDHAPWEIGRVEITDVRVDDVLAPDSAISFQVLPRANEDYIGPVELPISVNCDGHEFTKIIWRGEVLVRTEVVVTNRPLRRGAIITADDVALREVALDHGRYDGFFSPEKVIGKTVKRSVGLGQIVSRRIVEDPIVVKRGDMVMVHAVSGALRVSMKGKAVEDGSMGETIRVLNPSSEKEFVAKITGPSEVKVVF